MLNYTYRELGNKLDIEFNRPVSHALREYLKEYGFRFDRRINSWTGPLRRKDEALAICDRAVTFSRRVTEKKSIVQKCNTCWHADKGCASDCPWASEFKPVPGWTAKPTVLYSNERKTAVQSFAIAECPLYRRG